MKNAIFTFLAITSGAAANIGAAISGTALTVGIPVWAFSFILNKVGLEIGSPNVMPKIQEAGKILTGAGGIGAAGTLVLYGICIFSACQAEK